MKPPALHSSVLYVFVCLIAIGAMLAFTAPRASAAPSDELAHVLSEIRGLFSSDFSSLVSWAKSGHAAPPSDAPFQPQKTELLILALDGGDQHAVLTWLEGNGRGDLHTQGASDADIGAAKPGIDGALATATPNAWRNVPLVAASLDNEPQGKIQILGGFAAVKKDGTAGVACVSFKNLDERVAKRVLFEYPLLGADNAELGKIILDRAGEFSPNVDIKSFESMTAWQTPSMGPHAYNDGCIVRNLPTPALPFLQARAAGYHVTRVEYADGSTWPPGAATPPAPPNPAPTGAQSERFAA